MSFPGIISPMKGSCGEEIIEVFQGIISPMNGSYG